MIEAKEVIENAGWAGTALASIAYAFASFRGKRRVDTQAEYDKLVELLKEQNATLTGQNDTLNEKVDWLGERVEQLAELVKEYACPNAPFCENRPAIGIGAF